MLCYKTVSTQPNQMELGFIQLSASALGLALFLFWEQVHPFFAAFNHEKRTTHILKNLALGILNAALITFLFIWLWQWASQTYIAQQFGLFPLLQKAGVSEWVCIVLSVFLLDGWTYLWHWLNHRLSFLWRFHAVHHADCHMDVSTAFRFHFGEIFFSSLLRIPIIMLLGLPLFYLLLYETLMFAVSQFHHANISLPKRFDALLRTIIVTPSLHKVHHSKQRQEHDSNYGALFSFWDRLGGTLRIVHDQQKIDMGLHDFDSDDTNLRALLRHPFR